MKANHSFSLYSSTFESCFFFLYIYLYSLLWKSKISYTTTMNERYARAINIIHIGVYLINCFRIKISSLFLKLDEIMVNKQKLHKNYKIFKMISIPLLTNYWPLFSEFWLGIENIVNLTKNWQNQVCKQRTDKIFAIINHFCWMGPIFLRKIKLTTEDAMCVTYIWLWNVI